MKEANNPSNFAYAVNFGGHVISVETSDKMRRRMPPYRNFDFTSVGNGCEANTLISEPKGIEKGNISKYDMEYAKKTFDM